MVGHMDNTHHHRRQSPSSSSSSDFEFGISHSPATEIKLSSQIVSADQLFFKGQLLPLQLSPRLSMIKTSSSSETSAGTSSSGTTTSASRDSNGSSIDSSCTMTGNLLLLAAESAVGSSRRLRSAVVEDDESTTKVTKYFFFASLAARFSSVFNRYRSKETRSNDDGSGACGVSDPTTTDDVTACYFVPRGIRKISDNSASAIASTPREVIKKYVGKIKKLSGRRESQVDERKGIGNQKKQEGVACNRRETMRSLSGNPRPRRKKQRAMAPTSSCPASTFSSPTHPPFNTVVLKKVSPSHRHLSKSSTASSTMDDLHCAIQGAILHCKSSNTNKV